MRIPQFNPERPSYNTDTVVDIHGGWQRIYEISADKTNKLVSERIC